MVRRFHRYQDRTKGNITCQTKFDGDNLLAVALIQQYQLQLVGGHPSLDFINALRDWTVPELHDSFGEFADAIRFGEAAGLLAQQDVSQSPAPHATG
jgi:hypothetical protein